MKIHPTILVFAGCFILLSCRRLPEYTLSIVDIIPMDMSNESRNDAEPNIAVNPDHQNVIAVSALTRSHRCPNDDGCICAGLLDDFGSMLAPIFLSEDGGSNWTLREILPSNNGITHDISLAFSRNGFLYASFLKGCYNTQHGPLSGFVTYRSDRVNNSFQRLTTMTEIDNRTWSGIGENTSNLFDQPWVEAVSVGETERFFVGVNKISDRLSNPSGTGSGMTARVIVGNEWNVQGVRIENVATVERDLSGIRVAANENGRVYAVFYRWTDDGFNANVQTEQNHPLCDLVIVRDNFFGLGAPGYPQRGDPFIGLGDQGSYVEKRIRVSHCYPMLDPPNPGIEGKGMLGLARLIGSNISISINPLNQDHVAVAFCANNVRGVYSLYLKESIDGGINWTNVLPMFPIENVINPAIAFAANGSLGILYQVRIEDHEPGYSNPPGPWWHTNFILINLINQQPRTWRQNSYYLLSRFPESEIGRSFDECLAYPALGDYIDLQTVGNNFYGVFSAMNVPRRYRFPMVMADFLRETELLGDHVSGRVQHSIDPFFFKLVTR